MTADELAREREYLVQERLGMLCEDRQPTAAELALANKEASRRIDELLGEDYIDF